MLILRYHVLCCLTIVGFGNEPTDDACTVQPHAPCCSIPSVSLDTITVKYDVITTDSDEKPYNVTANITWDPPTDDSGYSYSVDFSPLFTVEEIETFQGKAIEDGLGAATCTDGGFSIYCRRGRFEIVIDTPPVTFGDLLFGFPYRISIQVIANGTASARTQCTSRVAPDCFETTENLEYCKNQTIPFSSVPRNLTVDIELPPNSKEVILHASWKKPLFVNGYIEHTRLTAHNTEKLSSLSVYEADIRNDTTSTTIVPDNAGTFRSGGFRRGFTYDFVATPRVILPDKYGLIVPQNGNAAVERIYIPDPIITGTRPSTKTTTSSTTATPTAPSETEQPFLVYIVIPGITVVGLLVLILCLLVIRRRILRKETNKKEQTLFSIRISHHSSKVPVLPEFREKEILNIYDVELSEEVIGSGQFGEVFKATLNLGKGNCKKQTVAVKRSKENLIASLREEFLDEIRLMIEIGNHPNIMPLLACRTVAEPYYLITEYMKYGSLKDYLHKSSNPEIVSQDPNYDLTDLRKLQFSHQISKGMEYLATTRFFHGDLAARNVLINEEMVAKISDFGLSNDIYAKGYVRLPAEQKRPVKWYSPEANHFGKCSTEGDVWSFGVVLYEIYSGGQEPYPGMLPKEVVVRVKAGYRMKRPDKCPNETYIIMRDCWQHEPADRPSFELIRQTLDEMLSRGDDPYFDPIGEHEGVVDDDSSSAASVDRVSLDSFIYDASLNITNSRMIPYIDEDPKLSQVNNHREDGK